MGSSAARLLRCVPTANRLQERVTSNCDVRLAVSRTPLSLRRPWHPVSEWHRQRAVRSCTSPGRRQDLAQSELRRKRSPHGSSRQMHRDRRQRPRWRGRPPRGLARVLDIYWLLAVSSSVTWGNARPAARVTGSELESLRDRSGLERGGGGSIRSPTVVHGDGVADSDLEACDSGLGLPRKKPPREKRKRKSQSLHRR